MKANNNTNKFGKMATTQFEDLNLQKEYTLKYFFGGWVKAETIFASSLEEAVYDAKASIKTSELNYALFLGKKRVVLFPNDNKQINNFA